MIDTQGGAGSSKQPDDLLAETNKNLPGQREAPARLPIAEVEQPVEDDLFLIEIVKSMY